MADTMTAYIDISGQINSRGILEGLARVAEREGLSVIEADHSDAGVGLQEGAVLASRGGQPLRLCVEEIANGVLPEVERFCIENGISFLRRSCGLFAKPPELCCYSPESGVQVAVADEQHWEPLLSLSDLEWAFERGLGLEEVIDSARGSRGDHLPEKLILAGELLDSLVDGAGLPG